VTRRFALAAAALLLSRAGMSEEPVVYEAEHALYLKPNLEIHEVEGASGGLAVGTFEGGGGNHTWLGGMNSSIDIGTAQYPFSLERAGTYRVWGRAWWSDKCGNSMLVAVDGRGRHEIGDRYGEDPVFRRWHWCQSDPFELAAGEHTLDVMAKEDGVFLDQWCIAPEGFKPPSDTAMERTSVPAPPGGGTGGLDVSLWRESEVADASGRVRLIAYIRRSSRGPAEKVTLAVDAGEKGAEVSPGQTFEVALAEGEHLKAAPLNVTYAKDSPRSEKLLRVTLSKEGRPLAERELVVSKPWRWRVLGPLPPGAELAEALGLGAKVDLAAELPPASEGGEALRWREPAADRLFNRYGTIDLEKVFGPKVGAAAYLYAEVSSPRSQKVTAFINNDDAVRIWLNGAEVFAEGGGHPAEGFVWRKELELAEGRNRFLVHITQAEHPKPSSGMESPNYWLFRLRLRAAAHRPAEVWGAE